MRSLWLGLSLVFCSSRSACSGGSGRGSISSRRRSRIASSRPTAATCSIPARSPPARTSGGRSAAWSSARSGATALRRARLDRRLAAPRAASSCSTSGRARERRRSVRAARRRSGRRRCASGCTHEYPHATPTTRRPRRSRSSPIARARSRRTSRYYTRRVRRTAATTTRCRAGTLADPERARAAGGVLLLDRRGPRRPTGPASTVTYTSNWPHEPLVGNLPTGDAIVWTGVSILVLLAGIGALGVLARGAAQGRAARRAPDARSAARLVADAVAARDASSTSGSSARCSSLQIVVGDHHRALRRRGQRRSTASRSRSSCRTRSRARGTCSSASSGSRPRGSRPASRSRRRSATSRAASGCGVNVLFGALVVVVVGSLVGRVAQRCTATSAPTASGGSATAATSTSTSAGSGRSRCSSGSCSGSFLVARALWPALRRSDEQRPLLVMLLISTVAIAGFYFAALGAGRHTNLAIAEYWRWWVVHLWVEGFFEVFATVVIAFLFARLGLVRHARRPAAPRCSPATIFLARRHHRHAAPPLLHRHADGRARARLGVQRARGRAAAVRRLRGLGELAAHALDAAGCARTAGRSTSSSRSRSGTWSAPGCSAS